MLFFHNSVMKGIGVIKLITRNMEYMAVEIKFQNLMVLIHSNFLDLLSV